MKSNDKFRITWSKREKDLVLHYPLGTQTSSDAHWLSVIFNNEFVEEIRRRGYNPETLNFSIEPQKGNIKFASQRKEGQNA